MENPLDTSTSSGETLAQQIAGLQRRVEGLERSRIAPATVSGTSLANIKAQLPPSAPNNTLVIGRVPSGGFGERVYLYVYEAAAGKWFRLAAFSEA